MQTVNGFVIIINSNISTSSCDIRTLYLVGMDGISMFIGIDHRQRDRHSVTNKCYSYCVSSNLRESVEGRHLWPRESRETRLKYQTTGCYLSTLSFLFFFKSKKLPSWDMANYLDVVGRVQ